MTTKINKNINYAFDLTEIITGLENPVLYKLDRKERFIIEKDVALVLSAFQSVPFTLSKLKKQLLALISSNNLHSNISEAKAEVHSFISFLQDESLIVPAVNARDVFEEVSNLEDGALDKRKLEIIGLELTNYCNFQCPHCSPDSGKKNEKIFQPLKVILDIITWANTACIREVSLTGGEPFAHPDICTILKKLGDHQVNSVITTNGSLLTKKHLEAIINSTVNVRVSLYGGPQYYETFGPSAKTSLRIRDLILKLKSKIGERLSCVIPVMGSNLNSYKDRVSFCKDNEIFYQVNVICPFGRALDNWERENIERNQANQINDEYEKYAKRQNPSYGSLLDDGASRIHIFPCSLNQLNILADGSVAPCLSIRNMIIGKCNKTGGPIPEQLSTFFFSKNYTDLQRTFSVNKRNICNSCEFKYDCGGGCPAKAIAYYGTVNAPDPQCENHNISEIIGKLCSQDHKIESSLYEKGGDIHETHCATCYQKGH